MLYSAGSCVVYTEQMARAVIESIFLICGSPHLCASVPLAIMDSGTTFVRWIKIADRECIQCTYAKGKEGCNQCLAGKGRLKCLPLYIEKTY